MVKLLVMSGVPGCGKSTWARKFISMHNAVIVSRDSIRFSLLEKDDDYFAREDEVTACFYNLLRGFIESGKYEYVIADATHNTRKSRNYMLDQLNLENVEVIPVNFEMSLQRCITQNEKRTGRACVPYGAIERMWTNRQPAEHGEKHVYADIWTVKEGDF